ncbi:MAG: hypothetical protein WB615_01580, partial [Candidatus Tumulicola sp.]
MVLLAVANFGVPLAAIGLGAFAAIGLGAFATVGLGALGAAIRRWFAMARFAAALDLANAVLL